jgi:hypothetical protein
MPKACSCCDSPADLSLCLLASTVGRAYRLQKCSESTAVCKSCMQGLLAKLANVLPSEILVRFRAAYTAICAAPGARSDCAPGLRKEPAPGKEDAR